MEVPPLPMDSVISQLTMARIRVDKDSSPGSTVTSSWLGNTSSLDNIDAPDLALGRWVSRSMQLALFNHQAVNSHRNEPTGGVEVKLGLFDDGIH